MKAFGLIVCLPLLLALSCGRKTGGSATDPDLTLARPVANRAARLLSEKNASELFSLYHPNYRNVFGEGEFTAQFRRIYPASVSFRDPEIAAESKTALFLPHGIGLKNVCTFVFRSADRLDRELLVRVVIDGGKAWLSDIRFGAAAQ